MLIDQVVIRHATGLFEESLHRNMAVMENVGEVNKTRGIGVAEVNDYSCREKHVIDQEELFRLFLSIFPRSFLGREVAYSIQRGYL